MMQQSAESSLFRPHPFSWAACVFTVYTWERGTTLPYKRGALSRAHTGARFYTWCLLMKEGPGAVRDRGQRHLAEGWCVGAVHDRGPWLKAPRARDCSNFVGTLMWCYAFSFFH
jgi:hypothetical protein